jgi:transposase
MSDLYWLSEAQVERLRPYFPKSRGKPRVDDRRVLSGIIYIQRNGLMWKHAPRDYGPPKTLYNRWKRWSRMGVLASFMTELAAAKQDTEIVMIDAPHLKTHPMASSLAVQKRGADG